MRSVSLVGVEGNSVVVEVPSDLLKGRIEQPNSKLCVEQSMSQVLGVSASLRCVLKGQHRARPGLTTTAGSPSGGEPDQAEPSPSSETESEGGDEAISEEDPMLQEALSLGAKVKNVE